jgi:hypothetical protein
MTESIAAGTFSADDFLDHVVLGVPVVPGGVVLELVLDAARGVGAVGIDDLRITRPLVVPDGGADWQVLAGELGADGRRAVRFCLRRGGRWGVHAVGALIDDPTVDGRDGFVQMVNWPVRSLSDAMRRDGLVPVRWRDVEVLPTAVRSHVVWDGDRGRVWLADRDGRPAGYVDEVVMAPLDVEAVRAEPVPHVYRVNYREVAPTVRDSADGRVVVELTGAAGPVPTALAALAAARSGARELVFLIDDSLGCAPVRGLARSLQTECPERTVRLVEARADAAPSAVAAALDAEEPELVVAGSALLAPELVPVALAGGRAVLDPDGAVLVTGGTGELGRLVAVHLVVAHGIRHLVLVSRRGADAPRVMELVAELEAAGALSVRVFAADVGDRAQVAEVLAAVDRPLTAVLHLAGVVDARLVGGQDDARFRRALVPKVDGAWHLHELTRELPLAAFVLFSSVASVFGSAGQSNYAAANAFLDALAVHRRSLGLVATSVSWGSWSEQGLSSYLGDAEVERLRRQGVTALSARQGLRIFDAVIAQSSPHLVAAVLAAPATVAPEPLASLPEDERWQAAVELVRREVAVVLGAPVGPRQVLSDAGVDSLMALELRGRLTAATGVPLPALLVVDHPTAHAIARLVVAGLAPAVSGEPVVGVAGAAAGVVGVATVWAALEHAGIVPKSLRGKRVGVFLASAAGDVAGAVAEELRLRGPAVTVCGSALVAVHLARVSVLRGECEVAIAGGDGVLVLRGGAGRAVVDSVLEGVGGGGMGELVAAVVERRWAEVAGRGARVVVEPCVGEVPVVGELAVTWPRMCGVLGEGVEELSVGLGWGGGEWEEVGGEGVLVAGEGSLGDGGGELVRRDDGEMKKSEEGGEAELVVRRVEDVESDVVVREAGDEDVESVRWNGGPKFGAVAVVDEAQLSVGGLRAESKVARRMLRRAKRPPRRVPVPRGVWPVLVSGRDFRGMRQQAARWAEWLTTHPEAIADVASTAALRRTHFAVRACVFAADTASLVDRLRALADGTAHPDVEQGIAQRKERIVFECGEHTGPCVAPRLLRDNPHFATSVDECDVVLRPALGWSVKDALTGDNELDLAHPDVVRASLVTVQVAMAGVLRGVGFDADDAFGTSAADVIVGRRSLVDAVRTPQKRELLVGELDEVVQLAAVEPVRLIGVAHVHGCSVHWGDVLPVGQVVDLPATPSAA